MDMTKVIIETFMDVEETNHVEDTAKLEEYNKLCIEMGLENLAYSPESHSATLIKKMNLIEKGVYNTLFRRQTELVKYKRVVPTRVLEALAKFKEEQDKIQLDRSKWSYHIWEMETDIDPVLVARNDNWEYFLIARWGEALQDFNTLRKWALESKKSKLQEQITRARNLVKAYENNPDAMALKYLEGDSMMSIYE